MTNFTRSVTTLATTFRNEGFNVAGTTVAFEEASACPFLFNEFVFARRAIGRGFSTRAEKQTWFNSRFRGVGAQFKSATILFQPATVVIVVIVVAKLGILFFATTLRSSEQGSGGEGNGLHGISFFEGPIDVNVLVRGIYNFPLVLLVNYPILIYPIGV